jgi:hypothetical protein
MRDCLWLLMLSALTAAAAHLASQALVPDALTVAESDHPHWYFQLAFILRSIEVIGLGGIVLVLLSGLLARFEKPSSTTR